MAHRTLRPASRLSVAVVGLSLCIVHCSSSSSGGGSTDGGPDASGDAGPPADGPTGDAPGEDSSSDSSSADAPGVGPVDAATCTPVAQYCADAGTTEPGCATTWSTAQHPSTWCPRVPYAMRVYIAPHCDGFDIVVVGASDSSSFYYYDQQTGALVGIEGHGNFGPLCIAGVSPGVPLTDCYDAGGFVVVMCGPDGSFTD